MDNKTPPKELPKQVHDWLQCRIKLVKETERVIRILNKSHLDVDKAKIAGSSASLAGGILGLVGTVLIFTPMAYVGVPLAIAGGVIGAAGAGTYAGSAITEWGIGKHRRRYIKALLEEDQRLYIIMAEYLERLPSQEQLQLEENKYTLNIGDLYVITSMSSFLRCLVKDLSVTPIVAMSQFMKGLREGGRVGMGVGAPLAAISLLAGGLVTALMLPVDCYFLYDSANDLWNQRRPELSHLLLSFLLLIAQPLIRLVQSQLPSSFDPSLFHPSLLDPSHSSSPSPFIAPSKGDIEDDQLAKEGEGMRDDPLNSISYLLSLLQHIPFASSSPPLCRSSPPSLSPPSSSPPNVYSPPHPSPALANSS